MKTQNLINMKKVMKAVAALMLMVSVVCATGCGNSNSTSSNGKNENKGSEAKTTEKPPILWILVCPAEHYGRLVT